ncbi:MAG: ATP-binding cassette domain-containing protein, partial [Clostridiales bacterium]
EISFGPRNFGAAEAKLPQIAAEALKAVGLQPDKFLLRSPFSLSGGEKRRVAIASVLAVGAEVLIFDEPTAGLDERGRRWILDLARRENESGKTIIWISHNMDEVAEVAGRLLVLDRGHLVADGSTDEVFAQEDKLAALGLDIPQPARLVRRLKDGGFPIPAQALVEDEAYQEISKALGGKNHDKR